MKIAKFQASSSIMIVDYDVNYKKFRVIRRIEVPKAEYSFDLAVRMIIDLNKLYDPSFIYMDRGYGDVQLEQLHKYGDEHPESGLKNKVKGWQFAQTIPVTDPIKKTIENKPMKPFMVSQVQILFERNQIILSPFDELLHKQLIDYEVVRIGANGNPVFSSQNEHFVDTLGLSILAFTLEFPNTTKTIDQPEIKNPVEVLKENGLSNRAQKAFQQLKRSFSSNLWGSQQMKNGSITYEQSRDPREPDGPKWFKVNVTPKSFSGNGNSWGSRSGGGFSGRSMW